ncbi:MAG: 2-amino-4-hydroxy-6-hydroxymethyldihydropteridine diphosphokinase [Gammaproteobacteria bacterium]|nr:2-amino-4-hydroxy-6-hydroxymethyldihydropteridine diphosphokinase [Gammaproteobacteria bacterium]
MPAYIGLGSNLDDPVAQLKRAFTELAALPGSRLIARSRLYRSAPLGGLPQPDYVNAVVAILTQLEAPSLLEALHAIERAHGRERTVAGRWAARTLDLDLLVQGDLRLDSGSLVIPHPGIAQRNFVLLPLLEVAPYLQLPGLGQVAKLAAATDSSGLELIG